MTEISEPTRLEVASVRRSRRISAIWTIPLVAIVIAAWLAWDTLSREGPTITISFLSAEGLQAGQSQLKYKDLTLGTVKSLVLSKDRSRVIVTVATTSQATPLLTEDTLFWVVKPRLFAGNLTGFETLLSGSYIGMLPGTAPQLAAHVHRPRGSAGSYHGNSRPHIPAEGIPAWFRHTRSTNLLS